MKVPTAAGSRGTVCVFGGSRAGHSEQYAAAARQLGQVLVAEHLTAVYGGGHVGMMGHLADAMLAAGGHVIGIIPDFMIARELQHPGVADMRVVTSMHERKALMSDLADAYIAMPGGLGTWEELLEVMTWAQLDLHRKPMGLLNTGGFYDPLLQLFRQSHESGFVDATDLDKLHVAPDAPLLVEFLVSNLK